MYQYISPYIFRIFLINCCNCSKKFFVDYLTLTSTFSKLCILLAKHIFTLLMIIIIKNIIPLNIVKNFFFGVVTQYILRIVENNFKYKVVQI